MSFSMYEHCCLGISPTPLLLETYIQNWLVFSSYLVVNKLFLSQMDWSLSLLSIILIRFSIPSSVFTSCFAPQSLPIFISCIVFFVKKQPVWVPIQSSFPTPKKSRHQY